MPEWKSYLTARPDLPKLNLAPDNESWDVIGDNKEGRCPLSLVGLPDRTGERIVFGCSKVIEYVCEPGNELRSYSIACPYMKDYCEPDSAAVAQRVEALAAFFGEAAAKSLGEELNKKRQKHLFEITKAVFGDDAPTALAGLLCITGQAVKKVQ